MVLENSFVYLSKRKKINMNDLAESILIVCVVFLILGIFGIHVGMDMNKTHHTTQPLKPSITITNVDGVVDTTYTYTFE